MSTYYEEKVVDPPVGDPIPFKLNYSPRAYELPGQPISVDKSGTVAARQVGGGVPRKPFRVTAITEAAKPATVTAGALPEKPFSISVLTSVDAPDSVTVVAAPRKPNTVSVQADPIKPASVTADAMPFAPTSVVAESDPKKPISVDADYIPHAPASVTADAIPFAPTSVVAESDPKKPISVDADYIPHAPAIVEVNAMPIAPVGVAAFSDPKKPISVDADYIPYAPSSVDADYIPYAPSVVSVNADPKQPLTVDADYIPYGPASVSAGQVPTVPSLVEAGLIPEAPSTVSVLAAPRQPSLAYAFEPFVVEIMETEAEIRARPASTPEGTVAFGTDTKKLYVFNQTGMDSWGAFAEDGFFRTSAYVPMKSARFEGHPTNDYGIATNINRLNGNTWTKESPTTMSGFLKFTGWGGDPSPFGTSGLHPGTTWNPARGSYSDGFHVNSSGRAYMWFGGGQRWITKDSVALYLVQNTWYHFAYTHDGSTLRCFLNGDEVFPSTPNQTSRRIAIPQIYVSKGRWNQSMFGMVDQVAFWDSVLDQTTIQSIASGDRNTTLTYNPLAYYSMDTESNDTVPDTSGNSQPDMYMIQDNASGADLVEEEPN